MLHINPENQYFEMRERCDISIKSTLLSHSKNKAVEGTKRISDGVKEQGDRKVHYTFCS